jgi:addiction module RelB/DinJ family antitoxin
MTRPTVRKVPAEIKFRVDPADKAQADQIAASVGMDTNTVMKVMFKRFLAERGFPFHMKAPANNTDTFDSQDNPLAVGVSRLAQISSAGFADAARAHAKAGRRQLHSVPARRAARHR